MAHLVVTMVDIVQREVLLGVPLAIGQLIVNKVTRGNQVLVQL